MANTRSAKRKTREIARRTKINQHRRSMMRGFISARSKKRSPAVTTLLRSLPCKAAEPQIMRASQKGIVHKKTASRKVSRLTHRIAKLAQ